MPSSRLTLTEISQIEKILTKRVEDLWIRAYDFGQVETFSDVEKA